MSTLHKKYIEKIVPELQQKFGYKSVMAVPKISKVCLNMGVGEAINDKKVLNFAVADMEAISGQKAVITKVRKSVAGFKIRDGWPVGCKVTMRGSRMYDFLDRLINISLPRVRDFRGLRNNGFDGMGNYNFGIKEQIVFPEIEYDKIDTIRGMDISLSTTARTNEEALALLLAFNLPLMKKN